MDFSKILPAIASVAPTIATMLGGPLFGMGVTALEGVFGLSPGSGSDPAVLQKAIAGMTPETAIALAKIDADMKAKLVDAGIDMERLAVDDRKSARDRSVQMHDYSPVIIGAMVLFIWGWINYFLLTSPKPPAIAGELVGRILGMIDAATMAFLYWLYGSSKGSAGKDATITALSK